MLIQKQGVRLEESQRERKMNRAALNLIRDDTFAHRDIQVAVHQRQEFGYYQSFVAFLDGFEEGEEGGTASDVEEAKEGDEGVEGSHEGDEEDGGLLFGVLPGSKVCSDETEGKQRRDEGAQSSSKQGAGQSFHGYGYGDKA